MAKNRPRVLVVEDELLIALDVEAMVEGLGCVVIGPMATVGDALAAVVQTSLDGAVLDINLGKERVWPVAELLAEKNIPFVLATGYGRSEIPARFTPFPVLVKPLTAITLGSGLRRARILRD